MGQLGVHFAIDAATAQRLLAADDDDALSALIEEIEMADPAGVHELHEDHTALAVDGVGHLAPCLHLLGGLQARGVG